MGINFSPQIERAVEALQGWDAPCYSWFHVDGDWHGGRLGDDDPSDRDPGATQAQNGLKVRWRGSVEEQAGVKVEGAAVGEFHRWSCLKGGIVYMPSWRPAMDAAMALSLMTIPRQDRTPKRDADGRALAHCEPNHRHLHPNLLMLFAREDVPRWRIVKPQLMQEWDGHPAVLDHAMASLMRPLRRNRVSTRELALMIGIRKRTYLEQRRCAEALILEHLEIAAREFLYALGNQSFPEKALNIEGNGNSLPCAA
ncbi:hypothetical protein EIM50_00575 [Pseudoxanthomonas sp. SGD-10]|nr:hypothetical protein EIM50_00575 [Pseudoxanthomonas sp. SGD-10]